MAPNCAGTNKYTVYVNVSNNTTFCPETEGPDDEGGDEYVYYGLRTEVQNLTESTKNGRNKHLYPELTVKSRKKNVTLNALLKQAIQAKDVQFAKRLLKEESDENNKKKFIGVCYNLKEWRKRQKYF
jgi:hypothetical protein